MKYVSTTLFFAAIVAVPFALAAQTPAPEVGQTGGRSGAVYEEETTYDFSDDYVEGQLVRPDGEGVRAALVPALGVVLGGVPGSGALDPRVDGSAPRVPTATDVLALRAGRPEVPGDLDGDGRVDFEDLLLMAAAYGRQGINLPEDLDGDGVVGDGDLELLRALYEFADREAPAGPSNSADPTTAPTADPTADAIDAPEDGPNDAPAEDAPPDREGDDDGEAPPDEEDGED